MAYDPFLTQVVDSIAPPEAITAQTLCHKVTVVENGDSTQDYLVRKISTTSHAIKRVSGAPFTFTSDSGSAFSPGQVVGYVETLTGSITMMQIEEY